jgi:tetratricopeptide (TPR) repeat protein
LGDAKGAIEHYERSIQLKPEFVEAHYNLGVALAKLQRFQEAAERFKAAIELRPDYPAARHHLGLALVNLKRDSEAVEEFLKALQIDRRYFQAQADLAMAYARLQRPADAIAAAKGAIVTARSVGQIGLVRRIEGWLAKYQAEHVHGGLTPIRPYDPP